jgi:hypothetical protein
LAHQPRLEGAVLDWTVCDHAPDTDTSANTGADSSIDADTGTSANNGADYSTDTDIEESIPMSLAGCSRLPGDLNAACKLKRSA